MYQEFTKFLILGSLLIICVYEASEFLAINLTKKRYLSQPGVELS